MYRSVDEFLSRSKSVIHLIGPVDHVAMPRGFLIHRELQSGSRCLDRAAGQIATTMHVAPRRNNMLARKSPDPVLLEFTDTKDGELKAP